MVDDKASPTFHSRAASHSMARKSQLASVCKPATNTSEKPPLEERELNFQTLCETRFGSRGSMVDALKMSSSRRRNTTASPPGMSNNNTMPARLRSQSPVELDRDFPARNLRVSTASTLPFGPRASRNHTLSSSLQERNSSSTATSSSTPMFRNARTPIGSALMSTFKSRHFRQTESLRKQESLVTTGATTALNAGQSLVDCEFECSRRIFSTSNVRHRMPSLMIQDEGGAAAVKSSARSAESGSATGTLIAVGRRSSNLSSSSVVTSTSRCSISSSALVRPACGRSQNVCGGSSLNDTASPLRSRPERGTASAVEVGWDNNLINFVENHNRSRGSSLRAFQYDVTISGVHCTKTIVEVLLSVLQSDVGAPPTAQQAPVPGGDRQSPQPTNEARPTQEHRFRQVNSQVFQLGSSDEDSEDGGDDTEKLTHAIPELEAPMLSDPPSDLMRREKTESIQIPPASPCPKPNVSSGAEARCSGALSPTADRFTAAMDSGAPPTLLVGRRKVVCFTCEHTHRTTWEKEIAVHKDVLFAAILAGVEPPLSIPSGSKQLIKNKDKSVQLHLYMEKAIGRIKVDGFRFDAASSIALAWWWATKTGMAVALNLKSGRVMAIRNVDLTFGSAASAVSSLLSKIMQHRQDKFFQNFSDYPDASAAEHYLLSSAASNLSHRLGVSDQSQLPGFILTPNTHFDILEDVINTWGMDDGVSPWSTTLIIKTQQFSQVTKSKQPMINLRYSLGVALLEDADDIQDNDSVPLLQICLQVHRHEALSRSGKAFPLCKFPLIAKSSLLDVRTTYSRAVWFLKRLSQIHQELEVSNKP